LDRIRLQKGFTMIELMIVIGIVAIVYAIAALSIPEYQNQTALAETARAVEGDLSNIRATARVRQQTVRVDFTATRYTAYIDLNGDNVFNAGDVSVLSSPVSSRVQMQGVAPFVIPGTLVYTNLGNIATQVQILFILQSDPLKRFRVNIFQTGNTQVWRSVDGGVNWFRPW